MHICVYVCAITTCLGYWIQALLLLQMKFLLGIMIFQTYNLEMTISYFSV